MKEAGRQLLDYSFLAWKDNGILGVRDEGMKDKR
jgi:hypothetical protein